MSSGMTTGTAVVVLAVGAGLLYPATIRPLLLYRSAESWPRVSCTVVECRSLSADEGARLVFRFRYEYEGRTYESTRYDLGSETIARSSQDVRAIILANPVGVQRQCSVNPERPSEAIAVPGSMDAGALVWMPIPPFLILLGLVRLVRGPGEPSTDGARKRSRPAPRRVVLADTHRTRAFAPPVGVELRHGKRDLDVEWKPAFPPGGGLWILPVGGALICVLGRSHLHMILGGVVVVALGGYLVLAGLLGRQRLVLDRTRLRVSHGPLPFPTAAPKGEVLRRMIADVLALGGQPGTPQTNVFVLRVELTSDRVVDIAGGLSREQASFLCVALRAALGLPDRRQSKTVEGPVP